MKTQRYKPLPLRIYFKWYKSYNNEHKSCDCIKLNKKSNKNEK